MTPEERNNSRLIRSAFRGQQARCFALNVEIRLPTAPNGEGSQPMPSSLRGELVVREWANPGSVQRQRRRISKRKGLRGLSRSAFEGPARGRASKVLDLNG